jgi:hypothetical protein
MADSGHPYQGGTRPEAIMHLGLIASESGSTVGA